jgi:hypothetical protein
MDAATMQRLLMEGSLVACSTWDGHHIAQQGHDWNQQQWARQDNLMCGGQRASSLDVRSQRDKHTHGC